MPAFLQCVFNNTSLPDTSQAPHMMQDSTMLRDSSSTTCTGERPLWYPPNIYKIFTNISAIYKYLYYLQIFILFTFFIIVLYSCLAVFLLTENNINSVGSCPQKSPFQNKKCQLICHLLSTGGQFSVVWSLRKRHMGGRNATCYCLSHTALRFNHISIMSVFDVNWLCNKWKLSLF